MEAKYKAAQNELTKTTAAYRARADASRESKAMSRKANKAETSNQNAEKECARLLEQLRKAAEE
eukprot:6073617-Pleurochrysis_carterae.AAC.1